MIEALLQAERLLVVGLVDQAERIYTSALEQDPLNAIAVVGLARVALERGDDRLAYQQARRALEIDPENAAAIRLELRLAEVLSRRDAEQAAADVGQPLTPSLRATDEQPERPKPGRSPVRAVRVQPQPLDGRSSGGRREAQQARRDERVRDNQ